MRNVENIDLVGTTDDKDALDESVGCLAGCAGAVGVGEESEKDEKDEFGEQGCAGCSPRWKVQSRRDPSSPVREREREEEGELESRAVRLVGSWSTTDARDMPSS